MAEYLINLVGNCCELFIILFFLKDNYKPKFKHAVFIPLCILFVMFQFVSNNLFLGKSELVIILSVFFTFFVMLLFEMNMWQRVANTILIIVVLVFSEVILMSILSLGFNTGASDIHKNILLFAIGTLTSKFLSYVFILFLRIKRFIIKDKSIKNNVILVFLLPIASILIMFLFLKCCYQIDNTGFYIITLIAAIVLILANIAIFYVIDKQNDLIETKEKLFFTETHINSQIAHYEQLYKHQTEIRTFRHDIKNILLSIMGILKESDTEKALQVMQANLDMLDDSNKKIVNTGHPITDAILQSKLHDADAKGIKLSISTKLTEKIIVDELELGIVLGNALDNAIEATAKVKNNHEKVVAFDMITTAERIIITIENPVDGNVNTDKLITTKKDKENHGYGVGSIKTIARKYDGVAEFAYSNGMFTTNINIANMNPNR